MSACAGPTNQDKTKDRFTQVAIICAQESRYKQTIFKRSSLGALLYYGSF